MTLPIEDRPADEIYPGVKEHLSKVENGVAALREKITSVILQDMTLDLALSESVDEVGAVIEYLIQDKAIERPNFQVRDLMRNLRRVTELLTSYRIAQTLEMPEHLIEQVVRQETERLWFDPNRPHPITSVKLTQPIETRLPNDIGQMMAAITKLLQKPKK